MQTLKVFSLFAAMLCSTIGFAKGHGGGHGGGHSGGHHSSARSSGGHTSPSGNTAKSAKNPAKRISTAASRRSRTTGANTRTRYVQLPASASYRVPGIKLKSWGKKNIIVVLWSKNSVERQIPRVDFPILS